MKLTNADKRFVQQHIRAYLKATEPPPGGKLVERTERWLDGFSMAEIAKQDQVSTAAVSQSITVLANAIIQWVEK